MIIQIWPDMVLPMWVIDKMKASMSENYPGVQELTLGCFRSKHSDGYEWRMSGYTMEESNGHS